MLFFFLMGLCKTLNCLAQNAKSPGGILVVRAHYIGQYLQMKYAVSITRKKKERREKKKREIIGPHFNHLLMITF